MKVISNIYDGQYKILASAIKLESVIIGGESNKNKVQLYKLPSSVISSTSTTEKITIAGDPVPHIRLYRT